MNKVLILDYGMGNLRSVAKKLHDLKVDFVIGASHSLIEEADKIILPGVGHFGKAMSQLKEKNLIAPLNEAVLKNKKPILGICLGMQLMTNFSEEGDVKGLGWIDAKVQRFNVNDTLKYKIPHTGWNSISIAKDSPIFKGISDQSELYFVHAFHVVCNDPKDVLNETEYEQTFTSAFQKENIYGMQFHPEKSHDVGQQIIKNFIEL